MEKINGLKVFLQVYVAFASPARDESAEYVAYANSAVARLVHNLNTSTVHLTYLY